MALVQALANQLLDAMHARTALPALTSPTRLRLMTAQGSATAAGTELATAQGHVAGAGAQSVTWAAAATGSIATSTAFSETNMPAATLTGPEVWDSDAGTPRRVEFGVWTGGNKTLASGDSFSIAAAALTSALA